MPTKKTEDHIAALPGHAQILGEKGSLTKDAVSRLHQVLIGNPLFVQSVPPYQILQEAFEDGWGDNETAEVLHEVTAQYQLQKNVDVHSLKRWLKAHKNDPGAVIDCLHI